MLHHLELDQALVKIHSLLKPGGYISFTEPNMLNPQIFLERKFHFLRRVFWYVSPDETAFVRWSLFKDLTKVGFDSIHITPFDWLHPATPPSLIPLIEKMGRILEKMPGVREFAGSISICCRNPLQEEWFMMPFIEKGTTIIGFSYAVARQYWYYLTNLSKNN